jgi:hypothetical protein
MIYYTGRKKKNIHTSSTYSSSWELLWRLERARDVDAGHGEEEAAALRSAAGASRRRSPPAAALSSGGGALLRRWRCRS